MPTNRAADLAPVLLCDASWYGTLAAVWDLGGRGVPVTLAQDTLIAPARFSRFATRTVRCPSAKDPRFVDWLLDFGARHPGHVLYPTSDEVAWHVAAHRDALARSFRLYSPPLEALVRVLDKLQLATDARAAGLDVPETACPRDEAEVAELERAWRFPVFLKPRAQVGSRGAGKGVCVSGPGDLRAAWAQARATTSYAAEVRGAIPGVDRPVIQAFHPGSERIYTVDGFVDETGALFATLACTKLLQRPRRSGAGILFERSPLDPAIVEGLRRLCRATGFHGVFDAEFVEADGRRLFIDFNPRFYNHMIFEVDRGLPLPWLAYLAACRELPALAEAVAQAGTAAPGPSAYVHSESFSLLLAFQALAGKMPREARRAWRTWVASHRGAISDPGRRVDDHGPALGVLALELIEFLRHPRGFLRGLIRGSD
jgi:predicted ATP-grasp superfamily ATP-dependent carboligase